MNGIKSLILDKKTSKVWMSAVGLQNMINDDHSLYGRNGWYGHEWMNVQLNDHE